MTVPAQPVDVAPIEGDAKGLRLGSPYMCVSGHCGVELPQSLAILDSVIRVEIQLNHAEVQRQFHVGIID
jgi:hypothetical protein